MKHITIVLLILLLSGCNKEIIHWGEFKVINGYVVSEVTDPPWIKIYLVNKDNHKVVVHLSKHCYNYKQIKIGSPWPIKSVDVVYSDYTKGVELFTGNYVDYIRETYCN